MIQVENLSFSYSDKPFISNMNFTVHEGEIFGFLGPSGAGKSTLQKILTGMLPSYKGSVSVNEIAHFIGIGEYKLFSYLRNVGILFKNENNDNVPYEKPVHKGKFTAIPAIAPDGSA